MNNVWSFVLAGELGLLKEYSNYDTPVDFRFNEGRTDIVLRSSGDNGCDRKISAPVGKSGRKRGRPRKNKVTKIVTKSKFCNYKVKSESKFSHFDKIIRDPKVVEKSREKKDTKIPPKSKFNNYKVKSDCKFSQNDKIIADSKLVEKSTKSGNIVTIPNPEKRKDPVSEVIRNFVRNPLIRNTLRSNFQKSEDIFPAENVCIYQINPKDPLVEEDNYFTSPSTPNSTSENDKVGSYDSSGKSSSQEDATFAASFHGESSPKNSSTLSQGSLENGGNVPNLDDNNNNKFSNARRSLDGFCDLPPSEEALDDISCCSSNSAMSDSDGEAEIDLKHDIYLPPSPQRIENDILDQEALISKHTESDFDEIPLSDRVKIISKDSEDDIKACPRRSNSLGSKLKEKLEKNEIPFEPRRITRGWKQIIKKENFNGKLVWGYCSGWWPALIIKAEEVGMVESSGKLWVFWLGESQISHLNEKTQIESFSTNLESRLAPQNTTFKKKHAINTVVQMIRKKLGCTILTKPYFSWLKKNLENIHDVDEINFCPYAPEVQRKLDKLKETNIKITEKYVNDVKRSPEEKVVKKLRKIVIEKDPTYLPLEEQQPGVITWAKIAGHNWWPAMIIDHRDGSMREPTFGCQWIIWYGDFKLSQVNHKAFLRFHKGMIKMKTYIQQTKQSLYLNGVLEAAKDYCSRLGINTESWKLPNAFKWLDNCKDQDIYPEPIVKNPKDNEEKYSMLVVQKINELKVNHVAHTERKENIKDSESLDSLKLGKIKLENICIMCLEFFDEEMDEHPFFKAFLCKQCSELYKPRVFVFGNDGKCFYCTLCSGHGTVVMCDKEDCPRVYCTACLKYLICPKFFGEILVKDPWECMLCKKDPRILVGGLMEPRVDWKERTIRMFRTNFPKNENMLKSFTRKNKKIRVLSLFDGLSTGLLVLLKLGISVDVYYASEIDPDALLVSESHFGTRVIQLGDVRDISENTLKKIAPIDLLIGGSPCNDLSLANPARLGLHDKNGTGILFFEYCRIKKLLKKLNRGNQFFWLFENVASMPSKYRLEINKYLGREPDLIDSADFSPQHRLRLYWHNLPIEPYSISLQSQQDVQDILTPNCNRYALVKKIRTVTTQKNSLKQGKLALKPIMMKDQTDTIWITELEEIFGFPRHYTDVKNMCATKRQHLIGRSWSVQTLMVVLSPLRSVFQTEERDDV